MFIGDIIEIVFEVKFSMIDGYKYEKNFKYINGLFNYYLDIRENLSFEVSGLIKVRK